MAEPDQLLELSDGAGRWARCGLWWSPWMGDRAPNPRGRGRRDPMDGDRSAEAWPAGQRGAAVPASDGMRVTVPTTFLPRDQLEAHDQLAPACPVALLGRIGRLEASGPACAAELLERACAELRGRGCSTVLAPLDGDTWHPYRVLEPGQDPAGTFAGEPDSDPRWSAWLAAAGFAVRARYVSSLCTDLQRRRPIVSPASLFHLVTVESLAVDDLLEPIHRLIHNGFRSQPLFVPISLDGFRRSWQPWRSRFDPRLSLLAFDGPELVGLLLAHPDRPQGRRAVVRTLVVQPGRRWAGLGRRLLETCQERAADLGCTAVIHALMHDPGASVALSRPYASPFRRYVLMGRSLAGEAAGGEVARRESRGGQLPGWCVPGNGAAGTQVSAGES